MLTAEELAARRVAIAGSADLQALQARLVERSAPLLARLPRIPTGKALLSVDGGVCSKDGATLTFDPRSEGGHRCPTCGTTYEGERHEGWWAKYQHLWLAERAAELATLVAVGEDDAPAARARDILSQYGDRYLRYPNRDNVLGPSRLFFSTYLESIWILNYLAAAWLLREAGALDEPTSRAVHQVADEAANLIGEFDEGFSNRQVWNNAALIAIAIWFEDEDLARRAIESETGLVAQLRGFRGDGMWYEGENYHLFALRGLLTGAAWARQAGVDFFGGPKLREAMERALLAPARSALPDLTFPARKDARYGVSLAQPMYLESWEVARGASGLSSLEPWLRVLYGAPPQAPQLYESYLHDAPWPAAPAPASRRALSWWSLLSMPAELPAAVEPWPVVSTLLEDQGLAVLRGPGRYLSLECGAYVGGHGHPDRLHLTLHADGVHWLPDFGTGTYVRRDLFWYRSTLAHNAPRLDGISQPMWDARCEAFDVTGDWAWVRGRTEHLSRAIIAGPEYVLDVVEFEAPEAHRCELPWHLAGSGNVITPGRWEPAELIDEFVSGAERFIPSADGPLVIQHSAGDAGLALHLSFSGMLLRAMGPGAPGTSTSTPFYVCRTEGSSARLVTVLSPGAIRGLRVTGDMIEVEASAGTDRHRPHLDEWRVETTRGEIALGGMREETEPLRPLLQLDPPRHAQGAALRLSGPPPLDGSLTGFDLAEPLSLDIEDQYRRGEEPFSGSEDFSAVAYAGWDDGALYLAVAVTKPDLIFRPADAQPLQLDNEPDDIHSDGLQIYVQMPEDDQVRGYLIVPEPGGGLRVRGAQETEGRADQVRGGWRRTQTGYCVTLAVTADRARWHVGARLGFDLLVNEMLPDRVRRAGQLVWSGGGGWVWLRGDRQSVTHFGALDLIG